MKTFFRPLHAAATGVGVVALVALFFQPAISQESAPSSASEIRFTSDNRLEFPANYRDWIFLSSGHGMTYGPSANPNGPPFFDNVFVNPSAYRHFTKSGRWPDKTIFVLEIRAAASEGSINKGGQFQRDVAAIEVEVKDLKHCADTDGWGYFAFEADHKPATKLTATESCYACHSKNGAVEHTFVQFYPTLISVAMSHNTLKTADGAK